MRKWALLLLSVISFASVVVGQTTVTVTANLQNTFGANVVGNAQVCFSLIDGAGNPIADPRTSTGLLISTDLRCVTPNGSGTISTALVPNNLIVPSGTQYLVAEYFQGTYVHGDNFTFNSNNPSYNLSTTAPNTPSNVTPVGFQAVLTNPIASQVITQPNATSFTIQNAPLLLSDGSPAAPAYAFINNPGNGISNNGSNLLFNVGGAPKLLVGTAGINLGTDAECYFLGASQDDGICRNAAGALSIGNGTPGDTSGSVTLALIKNADGSAATPSYTFGTATSSGWYHAGGGQPVYSISGTPAFTITGSRAQIGSGSVLSWGNGTSAITTADTSLSRDSAGVVDVGNGTAGNKSGSLNLSTVTLNGLTSGTATLSVSPTGGTLNLGSTNATVGPTGIITVAGCTGCGSGTFSGSEFGFNNAGSAGTSSLDTAFSRDSADVIDLGNGVVGDQSGTLNAGAVNIGGASVGRIVSINNTATTVNAATVSAQNVVSFTPTGSQLPNVTNNIFRVELWGDLNVVANNTNVTLALGVSGACGTITVPSTGLTYHWHFVAEFTNTNSAANGYMTWQRCEIMAPNNSPALVALTSNFANAITYTRGALQFQVQFGSASTGNSLTARQMKVTQLN